MTAMTSRSSTITEERTMKTRRLTPIHPGEILFEDLMKPLGLTANGLARELRVPVTRIAEIIKQRRTITADTALRLGRYFRTSAQFWMNLQTRYDIEVTERRSRTEIDRDVRPRAA